METTSCPDTIPAGPSAGVSHSGRSSGQHCCLVSGFGGGSVLVSIGDVDYSFLVGNGEGFEALGTCKTTVEDVS